SGATTASVTYYYEDETSSVDSTTAVNTLPEAEEGKRVTGFVVSFAGASMPTNAQATIPFTISTNPDQAEDSVALDNHILVEGESILGVDVSATARDDVIIYGDR